MSLPTGPFEYTENRPADTKPGSGHVFLLDGNGRKIAAIWGKPEEKIALAQFIVASRSGAQVPE